MNPNRGDAGPNLEKPSQPVAAEATDVKLEQQAERAATSETSPSKQSAPAAAVTPVVIPDANPVQLPVAAPDDTAVATATSTSAQSASDKLEKKWIDRAKQIVEQTKDDPFKQKSEMSKVKADYIKQRFNKTVKTDSGAV